MRLHHIQTMKQAGETVYPHKYHVSIALRDFIDKYSHLKNEEIHEDVVSVAGKIELKF
jgi:lysyl-tRNA synthetase class 2